MSEVFRETPSGDIQYADQLSEQVTALVGLLCQCNISRGLDLAGGADPAKDQVRVYTESALTAPQLADLDTAIAMYSPLPLVGRTGEINPAPNSNSWTDVPNAFVDVPEGSIVTGTVILRCFVGADYVPCGATLTFGASRQGGTTRLESWGVPGGRVARFTAQLVLQGSTVVAQVRRQGAATVRVRADIVFDVEPIS